MIVVVFAFTALAFTVVTFEPNLITALLGAFVTDFLFTTVAFGASVGLFTVVSAANATLERIKLDAKTPTKTFFSDLNIGFILLSLRIFMKTAKRISPDVIYFLSP